MVSLFWKKNKGKKDSSGEKEKIEDRSAVQKESGKKLETGQKALETPARSGLNWLVLQKPHFTEKALKNSAINKYIFIIKKSASKPAIKNVIESLYHVNLEKINIINIHAKSRRLGRIKGTKSGFKKAIVTLEEGQKLDIYPTQ